jgi:hypothetical protein
MMQAMPPPDYVSIAALVVAIASFIASLASVAIAKGARKDAERIAERAHDEWAQQKWFDLYFLTNSAYDAMSKLQADCNVQADRLISIRGGGNYPDRVDAVIRLFREIQAIATVFPRSAAIDMLCAATSEAIDTLRAAFDANTKRLSEDSLKKLKDAMNNIQEKALVDTSVLKRVIK